MRGPNVHSPAWRVANVALFVLALIAALAVIVGVLYGIWAIASQGRVRLGDGPGQASRQRPSSSLIRAVRKLKFADRRTGLI